MSTSVLIIDERADQDEAMPWTTAKSLFCAACTR